MVGDADLEVHRFYRFTFKHPRQHAHCSELQTFFDIHKLTFAGVLNSSAVGEKEKRSQWKQLLISRIRFIGVKVHTTLVFLDSVQHFITCEIAYICLHVRIQYRPLMLILSYTHSLLPGKW